jgi:hypothetical protein
LKEEGSKSFHKVLTDAGRNNQKGRGPIIKHLEYTHTIERESFAHTCHLTTKQKKNVSNGEKNKRFREKKHNPLAAADFQLKRKTKSLKKKKEKKGGSKKKRFHRFLLHSRYGGAAGCQE